MTLATIIDRVAVTLRISFPLRLWKHAAELKCLSVGLCDEAKIKNGLYFGKSRAIFDWSLACAGNMPNQKDDVNSRVYRLS